MTVARPTLPIAGQVGAKRGRGRPQGTKDDLIPYMNELERRFMVSMAMPTLEQEAKALDAWGREHAQRLKAEYGYKTPKGWRSIRERLVARFNGPEGYRMARAWRLSRRHWPELAGLN